MDVEVLQLAYRNCTKKIGCLVIRYNEIHLKCDLVYYPPENKAWIRMPEQWVSKTHKKRYCYWMDKEVSDKFQEIVLKQIFDKYNLSLEQIAELHKLRCAGECENKNE